MPRRAPRICACGRVVAAGVKCACEIERDKQRKQRFDQKRPSASARGYDSKWRSYREAYLRKHPTCVMCGAPASVVDHVKAHKGDMNLFWRHDNHQALCATCHNSRKQSLERRASA
jgi:5-methylcytosine-specific restriction protein A